MKRFSLLLFATVFCSLAMRAQDGPRIDKIDPPDWWAGMPKSMLLVRGEHLCNAQIDVSDERIQVERATISGNCHWVELWLSSSPEHAEDVKIRVHTSGGQTSATFRFNQRKRADEGFAGFSSADVMYLIMTDRFADGDLHNDGLLAKSEENSAAAAAERAKPRGWHGGDLKGIEQHLDYIRNTGFDTVWMTPVYANEDEADSYHGYGATDMFAVDPHYGTLTDLQSLGAALHRRGMKLVLDTVPNHVGPKNPWTEDEPDPQWLHGTVGDHHAAVGDFKALVDPHAPWRDQQYVLQGWFANVLPDLNQENPATAQYLVENAIWWIEKTGADGLRIDTFPYVGRSFWQAFHAQIHALYPNLTTVGEVFNCDATITSWFAGGVTRNGVDTGLDTPFDFPSYCALRDVFLKGTSMTALADVWRMDAMYPHPERLIPFLGNHDTSRFASAPGSSPEAMRLAFAVLLTMRGMPQVYSGDEIAMNGGDDPDNRHDFPGGWPDAQENAFTHLDPSQAAMHDWVQQLLELRAKEPALKEGSMQVLSAEKDVLAYARIMPHANNGIVVVINRSSTATKVQIALEGTSLDGSTRTGALIGGDIGQVKQNLLLIDMPGSSVWIGEVEK